MNTHLHFISQTKALIDNLKSVCANYGNEFKIITQVFLYKFINDKFRYEAKKYDPALAQADNFQQALEAMPDDAYEFLMAGIGPDVPKLYPREMISYLYNRQNQDDFAVLFDETLRSISVKNTEFFRSNRPAVPRIKCSMN